MSDSIQNRVIIQGNGEQGATTYGPRLRNKASPSKHGNQDVIRTIELQLDGDVQEEQVFDALNETQWALPAGCLILDIYAFSSTGVAALSLGSEDVNGLGGAGNLFAGALAADSWTVTRDVDLGTTATSQLVFSGVAPADPVAGTESEKATVYITFLQVATDGGEDGVLTKPRVQRVP